MSGQAVLTIRSKQWTVSLAITSSELVQGLGGLPSLAAQTGMLFDMGAPQIIQVTTVPMLFPLDIAFLSETLAVTEVYRNILPNYLVTSTQPARYFLEVNAGELEGIAPGDTVAVQVTVPPQTTPTTTNWTSMITSMMPMLMMVMFMAMMVPVMKGIAGPEKRPELLPETRTGTKEPPARGRHEDRRGKYILHMDRMGNIIITHSEHPGKSVFLQFESDKDLIYDVLRKSEKAELDKGWNVEVMESEPRASILQELWETSVGIGVAAGDLRGPVPWHGPREEDEQHGVGTGAAAGPLGRGGGNASLYRSCRSYRQSHSQEDAHGYRQRGAGACRRVSPPD